MHHRSPKASSETEPQTDPSQLSQLTSNQHGFNVLVKENLTHVTSYLDPASLFALSAVNKLLHEHVKDDHTWRRAFLHNFLGIKAEAGLDATTGILLRRSESSWSREYVTRCNTRRRWESHRNQTIAYAPVHSSVSDIHLLRSQNMNTASLLASSLQYGIVSRSLPCTGKVLRGFLSPSLAGTGLGIGNPNTEFAPDVTACAMTSDGGTAKIAWGMRNGEVALSTAAKTMDTNTRSAAKLTRCRVQDQHEGEVVNIAWDDAGGIVVSGAKDGRVKIWDAKTLHCLWTSEYLIPEYPIAVRLEATKAGNVIVVGMNNGDVIVWAGLDPQAAMTSHPNGFATMLGTKVKVPCPVKAKAPEEPSRLPTDPTINALYVDVVTDTRFIYVVVAYDCHPEFYRIAIPFESSTFAASAAPPQLNITIFKDPDSFIGTVSSVFSCFRPLDRDSEASFVIAGSSLGWVCVYPYPQSSTVLSVEPFRKFEAHPDGSGITAIAWNSVTLVTGSINGTTSVFDSYTFERLRTFSTPIQRSRGGNVPTQLEPVKKILLGPDKDLMVVTVGDRVMGFKADLVPKCNKMRAKKVGKKKARGTILAKGHDHHMLNELVSDSMHEYDAEIAYMRKVYRREQQQQQDLERLGLDEVEAVEYVLMLSRDEALAREAQETQGSVEEGVFEGDFDFGETIAATTSSSGPGSSSSRSSNSSASPPLPPTSTSPQQSQSPPRSSRPIYSPYTPPKPFSNDKLQISPRLRQEAREAGWGGEVSLSELSGAPGAAVSQSWGSVASSISDMDLAGRSTGAGQIENPFPSISPKMTKSLSEGQGTGRSRKGAWASGSPSSSAAWSSKQVVKNNNVPKATPPPSWSSVGDDEDEDLKLAIQLSLEEARLRGEAV